MMMMVRIEKAASCVPLAGLTRMMMGRVRTGQPITPGLTKMMIDRGRDNQSITPDRTNKGGHGQ
jgi:hypothetical protein